MKTKSKKLRPLLAIAALGAIASFTYAGPGLQYWTRTRPVTTAKEAEAVKPNDSVAMVCGACKTVMIRDSKQVGPPKQRRIEWFDVGSKHECEHCGGAITVVKGKTKDEMQHNCSKCGEGAAFCCVESAEAEKK